MNDLGVSNA